METEPRTSGGGRLLTAVAWAMVLVALWAWGVRLTGGSDGSGLLAGGTRGQLSDGRLLPPPLEPLTGAAVPTAVEIGAIGVSADVIPRGVESGGGVEPPPYEAADIAGWYDGGPAPGAAGAAVLVGHVDTETAPAVFYGLSAVSPGSEVSVARSDGTTATFTVERVDVVERAEFDAEAVYGAHDPRRAELRLITCGGTFDRERGTYSANVVVSAYLTGTGGAGGPAGHRAV
ncbi:class F sortase [Streptomyces bohaiensis]|uniref:class F sortase n=1 Tax=Streptomyces bohaiensis TaxID=1431344 RepID=UPI003B7DCFD9